ncbi:DivIVA domain-containing protein [bacterium]|nr:DivIVA domain-containing protein [bacterium]
MGLSPLEIRKQEFKKGLWGFKKSDVELFREAVEETVNELLNEIEGLNKEIKTLNGRLSKLENQSSAIKEAIELAKKEARRILEEALIKAENIKKKADDEFHKTQDELSLRIKEKKEELYELQNLKDTFKQKFLYFLEEESKLMERFEHEHHSRRAKEILEGIGEHEIVSNPITIEDFLKYSSHLRNRFTL